MPQGKTIDRRERELIVQLKEHFDFEKLKGSSVSTLDPTGRVAQALGLGERTVKEIVSTYRKTGKVAEPDWAAKGKPPYRIQPALETVIRNQIRLLNRQGTHVSLRGLSNWLGDNYEKVPRATLGRALRRMGFVYGKSRRQSALRERDYVLIARRAYLRTKIANRDSQGGTIRPEVYLDESYVNVNHSSERTWYFTDDGPWVQKPSGKGPRLILVHAMTVAGWVEGAKLVFQAKKRTGDYHGQMNFENFRKWFVECLLPRLPASSLIIMDNAPYHKVYVDGAFYPTSSSRKAELKDWLEQNHPAGFLESMLKAELLELCRNLCPKPEYELDRIAKEAGHQILRTPQYHPELQPIEECWGVIKYHCATSCDYTMHGLRQHLENGFNKVTSVTCKAAIADMRSEEDRYWREDVEDDLNDDDG
jgi:transposase